MTTYECLSLLVNFLVGGGLIWIGFNSNKIVKNQLRASSRKAYLSVYDMLNKALSVTLEHGKVNDEARELFHRARDRSRLELPEEIGEYCQGIFNKMWEAYTIYYNDIVGECRIKKGEKRSKAVARHQKIILELHEENPYKLFSQYMRVEK